MGDKEFVATRGQGIPPVTGKEFEISGLPRVPEAEQPPRGEIWEELELPEVPQSCSCTNTSPQPPSASRSNPCWLCWAEPRESCIPFGKVWSWEDQRREDSQVWR